MKRAETLDKAKETVTGHREQKYGTPEHNFAVIAELWNTYLIWKKDEGLTAKDVAHMMILFKAGRATTGTGTEDTYVDIAGYAACAAEIVTEDEGGGCDADYCTIN